MEATSTQAKIRGIDVRHQRACRSRRDPGGRCNCDPGFRAWIYSAEGQTKIRRTFSTLNEAKRWRSIASVTGRPGPPREATTFEDEARSFIEGIRSGAILNRSGAAYKPSVVRAYAQDLERYIIPEIGERPLDRVSGADLRRLIAALRTTESARTGKLLQPATVRNALLPVRAIYRNAILDDRVERNPTTGLVLEQVRGRRERVASREEISTLLAPLRAGDRAIFATALFAGLRLGELRALRWKDVDFASNELRVEGSWDAKDGRIDPKTRAGRRKVPISPPLKAILLAQRPEGRLDGSLVFGREDGGAFNVGPLYHRSDKAWRAAGVNPIRLHECRHSFASNAIAAGFDPKAIAAYMGHSSIQITFDLYGKLLPGDSERAVARWMSYFGP